MHTPTCIQFVNTLRIHALSYYHTLRPTNAHTTEPRASMKVLIVGGPEVGKSAIFRRWTTNKYASLHVETIKSRFLLWVIYIIPLSIIYIHQSTHAYQPSACCLWLVCSCIARLCSWFWYYFILMQRMLAEESSWIQIRILARQRQQMCRCGILYPTKSCWRWWSQRTLRIWMPSWSWLMLPIPGPSSVSNNGKQTSRSTARKKV